ncbi:MAG: hypothetical protein NTZ78_02480 [Candidatus Aureabacteria bacterium]|nr:hypothetical protein [Candidatus Auribacterota bacterium]
MKEITLISVGMEKAERLSFPGGERVFSVPCTIGEGIPLPENAYGAKRAHYLSTLRKEFNFCERCRSMRGLKD